MDQKPINQYHQQDLLKMLNEKVNALEIEQEKKFLQFEMQQKKVNLLQYIKFELLIEKMKGDLQAFKE